MIMFKFNDAAAADDDDGNQMCQVMDLLVLDAACCSLDNVACILSMFPEILIPEAEVSTMVSDMNLVLYQRVRSKLLGGVSSTMATSYNQAIMNNDNSNINHEGEDEGNLKNWKELVCNSSSIWVSTNQGMMSEETEDTVNQTKRLCVEEKSFNNHVPNALSHWLKLPSTTTTTSCGRLSLEDICRLLAFDIKDGTVTDKEEEGGMDWFVLVLSLLVRNVNDTQDILQHLGHCSNDDVMVRYAWTTPSSSSTRCATTNDLMKLVSIIEKSLWKISPSTYHILSSHVEKNRFDLGGFLHVSLKQCWFGVLPLQQCVSVMGCVLEQGVVRGVVLMSLLVCRHVSKELLIMLDPNIASTWPCLCSTFELNAVIKEEISNLYNLHGDWIEEMLR
jgi:hypothetical protein